MTSVRRITLPPFELDELDVLHLVSMLSTHARVLAKDDIEMRPVLVEIGKWTLAAWAGQEPCRLLTEPTASASKLEDMTTVSQVAAVLGISTRSVERLVASGEIDSRKIGRARRIPATELERLAGTRRSPR